MDIEEIIRKNKQKRASYIIDEPTNKKNLKPELKYLKGLISRVLLAIIFVLISIIYTNTNETNKELYKTHVLENSLSFTKINNLYQDLFGTVDINPKPKSNSTPVFFNSINYTNIENYKNGTKLTMNTGEIVNVITSGIVVFIGEKDDLGNTVIIQGNDGVDIWYSNITDTDIKIYDYIESGSIIGTTNSDYLILTINKDGKYLTYEEYKNLA